MALHATRPIGSRHATVTARTSHRNAGPGSQYCRRAEVGQLLEHGPETGASTSLTLGFDRTQPSRGEVKRLSFSPRPDPDLAAIHVVAAAAAASVRRRAKPCPAGRRRPPGVVRQPPDLPRPGPGSSNGPGPATGRSPRAHAAGRTGRLPRQPSRAAVRAGADGLRCALFGWPPGAAPQQQPPPFDGPPGAGYQQPAPVSRPPGVASQAAPPFGGPPAAASQATAPFGGPRAAVSRAPPPFGGPSAAASQTPQPFGGHPGAVSQPPQLGGPSLALPGQPAATLAASSQSMPRVLESRSSLHRRLVGHHSLGVPVQVCCCPLQRNLHRFHSSLLSWDDPVLTHRHLGPHHGNLRYGKNLFLVAMFSYV
jgi:hypothetical protein